jgi:DNA gyrase/topoisomerase IV subunit A
MYTPVSSGTLLPRTVQNQMQTLGQNSVQVNNFVHIFNTSRSYLERNRAEQELAKLESEKSKLDRKIASLNRRLDRE